MGIPSPLLASRVSTWTATRSTTSRGPWRGRLPLPRVAAGYYKDEDATKEAFRGRVVPLRRQLPYDDDGLRVMVDRYKDLVKSGGENVSTIRVEAVIVAPSSVAKVAVVGLLDDRWGEAVTAVVVPRRRSTADRGGAHRVRPRAPGRATRRPSE